MYVHYPPVYIQPNFVHQWSSDQREKGINYSCRGQSVSRRRSKLLSPIITPDYLLEPPWTKASNTQIIATILLTLNNYHRLNCQLLYV